MWSAVSNVKTATNFISLAHPWLIFNQSNTVWNIYIVKPFKPNYHTNFFPLNWQLILIAAIFWYWLCSQTQSYRRRSASKRLYNPFFPIVKKPAPWSCKVHARLTAEAYHRENSYKVLITLQTGEEIEYFTCGRYWLMYTTEGLNVSSRP